MSAITFRKGNPISHDRTLRFLLVCKVIGSPSRSRFAPREVQYSAGSGGTLSLGETRFRNYKMPGGFPSRPLSATFLSSIYVSIPLSSRLPFAEDDLSPRPLHRFAARTSERPRLYAVRRNIARSSCQWRSM